MPDALDQPTFTVRAAVHVDAPPEQISEVFCDDARLFELHPGLVDHRDVVPLVGGGHSCTQEYEIRGHRIVQHCVSVVHDPPRRFVTTIEGDSSRAHTTLTLEPTRRGTELRMEVTMTVLAPSRPLQRAAMRVTTRRRTKDGLQRIKRLVER